MNNPLRPAGLSIKRDQVWRSDLVRSACNAADLNPGSIIFLYKTLQSEVSSKDTWEQLLQNFIGARTKLKFDKSLTLVQALAVYGYAVNILKLTNVSPERSKLSFLYDDLWVSLADRYKDSGHLFLYDWYRALAHIQPGTLPLSSTIDLDAACTQHFATLSDHGPPSELVREIWQSRMQGFSLHAWKLASLPKILEGNASESNIDFLTWEKAVVSCQISKDVSALASLARDKRTEFTAGQQSLAWLWALALPQKDATMMIQETVAKLKRRTGLSLANTRSLQLCNALHLAFDPKVPIHNRMEDLGIAASKIGELASLELQIVAFLSVMRTLFKLRQHNLVNCCLVRYESLSAVCSNGATSDIFSLTEEIRSSQPNYRKPSPVASNILSRGGRLAGVSLEISRILGPLRTLKLVKGNYKNISLTQEETIACAQLLGQCLSDLHGPIAKFGQLLGHYLGVTSHPLGKALSVLHDSNTPVPFIDIERILAKEFNAPLHSLFKRIQPEPVGVGTVAQVHRATTIQGEEVALKIKLPGIKQVFINDLRVLGAITPILKILLPHIDFQGIYTEIRRGLFSEIDFAREVEMQKRLAIMFSNDPDIAIPKLFPEFCSDSVIGLEVIY
ncbi:MAG: AarF/ABC1/UbiB kinase family protein [Proteobacteria bacterium]|nr:AarF/ABC1/UbiB kinase family protein [Pseudomonadota bacterium]